MSGPTLRQIERLAGDWEIARFTANIPHPYPPGSAAPWIEETWAEARAGKKIVAAIERRADGALVGCVELDLTQGPGLGVLGFWVGRPYWGAGIASEAASAVIALGFDALRAFQDRGSGGAGQPALDPGPGEAGLAVIGERDEPSPARGGAMRVEIRSKSRPSARTRLLVSAVALVDVDGRVLLARRPPGKTMAGLWEFPGGKVRQDETPEAALIRELKEELAIDVTESCLAPFTFAIPPLSGFRSADAALSVPALGGPSNGVGGAGNRLGQAGAALRLSDAARRSAADRDASRLPLTRSRPEPLSGGRGESPLRRDRR